MLRTEVRRVVDTAAGAEIEVVVDFVQVEPVAIGAEVVVVDSLCE